MHTYTCVQVYMYTCTHVDSFLKILLIPPPVGNS